MAFSTIQGSGAAPDSFVGTSGVDSILIQNVRKAVFLDGDAANDVISWANFTDLVSGYTLKGGQGNDIIGGAISGAIGERTVTPVSAITSSFINGNSGNDRIGLTNVSNSTVSGGQGIDVIAVGGVFGGVLNGAQVSNSVINGNAGNDEIQVFGTSTGTASSSIFGGQGSDTITLAGSFLATDVRGDNGDDTINIGLAALNQTTINGGEGNDRITLALITSFTSSTVFGGEGDDIINAANAGVGVVISGDNGNDQLTGSAFADTILGGEGNDSITGGLLADTMTGGAGVNTFVIATLDSGNLTTGVIDVITDFKTSGAAATRDVISGTAFTNGIESFGTALTYAAAATDAAATNGTNLFAVGAGTSFTAVLFEVTAGVVTAAVQLGTTGQFGSAAFAQAAIVGNQINPVI